MSHGRPKRANVRLVGATPQVRFSLGLIGGVVGVGLGLLEVMWRERGLTMVLVTHDSTVGRRAQRIGVMKKGLLSFRRPARDLTAERLRPPDLEAADSVPADE
jgi:hypothetical protein